MQAILVLVEAVLGRLVFLQGLLAALGIVTDRTEGYAQTAAVEAQAADLLASQILSDLRYPEGTPHNLVDMLTDRFDALDDAIAALTPVTLPPTPPAGYGGASAEDVWSYPTDKFWPQNSGQEWNTLDHLMQAGVRAGMQGYNEGWVDPANPYFAFCMIDQPNEYHNWWNLSSIRTVPPVPAINWSAWDGVQTIVQFLNAQAPGYTWSYRDPDLDTGTQQAWAPVYYGASTWWRCLVTDAMLPIISGKVFADLAAGASAAPIWPGTAGVTLGTPVALSSDLTIPGPLSGILVAYTTPPSGVSTFKIGDFYSYSHTGQVAFVSDHGEAENWQYLQWNQALYVPKAMSVANAALVRGLAGVAGTVTPWSIA